MRQQQYSTRVCTGKYFTWSRIITTSFAHPHGPGGGEPIDGGKCDDCPGGPSPDCYAVYRGPSTKPDGRDTGLKCDAYNTEEERGFCPEPRCFFELDDDKASQELVIIAVSDSLWNVGWQSPGTSAILTETNPIV